NALILDTGIDFHHHADRLVAGIRQLSENAAANATITLAEQKRREAVDRTEGALPGAKRKDQPSLEVPAPAAMERRKFKWKQKQIAMAGGGLVLVAAICFGIVMFEKKRPNRVASST